jgi:glycosyltransferase involved in cell wall biosynthesis
MHSESLVSAIMPTRGRQQWAAEAVEMFSRQTWANRELVIVDDKADPSFPDGIETEGVQYFSISGALSIGAKRNLAVARSRGQIIMHWDSDDIYTDDRMEHQARLLLASQGVDLVGYGKVPWIETDGEKRTGVYNGMPGIPDYCLGVSMTYWKSAWRVNPFPDLQTGEDGAFLMRMKAKSVDSEGRITFRIHNGNTDDKRIGIARAPRQWGVCA